MNTSICPNCKTKLERNPVQEGNLIKYIGVCECGYSADVTGDILRENQDKSFSKGKLKQFLASCPKPGLNETIKHTYSELKNIMQTNNDELVQEILNEFITSGKIKEFALMGTNTPIYIIHPTL